MFHYLTSLCLRNIFFPSFLRECSKLISFCPGFSGNKKQILASPCPSPLGLGMSGSWDSFSFQCCRGPVLRSASPHTVPQRRHLYGSLCCSAASVGVSHFRHSRAVYQGGRSILIINVVDSVLIPTACEKLKTVAQKKKKYFSIVVP